jgi:hypothetical protein
MRKTWYEVRLRYMLCDGVSALSRTFKTKKAAVKEAQQLKDKGWIAFVNKITRQVVWE